MGAQSTRESVAVSARKPGLGEALSDHRVNLNSQRSINATPSDSIFISQPTLKIRFFISSWSDRVYLKGSLSNIAPPETSSTQHQPNIPQSAKLYHGKFREDFDSRQNGGSKSLEETRQTHGQPG